MINPGSQTPYLGAGSPAAHRRAFGPPREEGCHESATAGAEVMEKEPGDPLFAQGDYWPPPGVVRLIITPYPHRIQCAWPQGRRPWRGDEARRPGTHSHPSLPPDHWPVLYHLVHLW